MNKKTEKAFELNTILCYGKAHRNVLLIFLTVLLGISAATAQTADFTLSPDQGCSLPHTVFFTDQSISPDTWNWNFGDGSSSTVKNPVHSYTIAGNFTVTLYIQDTTTGISDTHTEMVQMALTNPQFAGSSLFGCNPLTVNFTDASTTSTGSTITSRVWNFGDGQTSTLTNPTNIYEKPGNYTVTLTTTNSLGCTHIETKTNYVQVLGPNLGFSKTASTVNTINFTDQSTSGSPIVSRSWNFGDGASSTLTNPTHTYTSVGTYDVSLTVADLNGCSRTLTKTNFVNTIPGAYDVSIAIYDGDEDRFSVAAQETIPRSLAFNSDGTKMFVMGFGGLDINEYTLGTAYDVSTAVYGGDGERFSVAAQDFSPLSLAFNGDGTRMFVLGDFGNDINEYVLAAAYDVSSAVYAGDAERFSVAAQETLPTSMTFSGDGTRMFVMGVSGGDINEYFLAAPYDVSTAVYAGDGERFSVSAQETEPFSLAFNGDGTKMFVMGFRGVDINEYVLGTAYDVSTAVYAGDSERFSIAAQETNPNSLAFNGDGTKMFVIGTTGNDINEYSLAAPVITGALAGQAVNDLTIITPFAAITVADPNGDNVSATITLDNNAKGTLSGTGLSGSGPYTLASTDAASLQAALRALVFDPADNRIAPASTEITTFTLEISDGTFSDIDSRTTVVVSPVAPTVTLSSTATSPTSAFMITATFNEPVTGFELADFTVGNGTASDFNAVSTTEYTALITPDVDGLVTVDIAAGVAQDNGGVDNTAASQFSINADISNPTVLITSTTTSPTNGSPIPVTITFNEEVTGFNLGDLTIGNGSASNFSTVDNIVFTVDITPAIDGTVTVDIAAAIARDLAGNDNVAATQLSILYDNTDPTLVIISGATSPTNGNPIPVTITFSEEVTSFILSDLTIGNGSASNFSTIDNILFTADITPAADGNVTVDIAAAVAQDLAGNGNEAAVQFSMLYDGTAPAVIIASTATNPTNSNPIPVTITFSEEVTGFNLGDLTIGNGSASNFSTIDNILFTADITPAADGNVTVDIASASASDLTGNDNTTAQFSIIYDGSVTAVICQDITVQLNADGMVSIDPGQIDNGSSDNFGIASRTLDINTFTCGDIGDNNVVLTVTDNNGNSASCMAVVIVEDNIAPTVITRDITVPLDINGQASITPADIDNGSTDNCGIASRVLDITAFNTPTTPSTTVTLTVTDINGNRSAGTAVVTFDKLSQVIVFDPVEDKKVGQSPVILQATGGQSGLPVIFSISTTPTTGVALLMGNQVIIEGPGTVVVTASQEGNDIFEPAEDVSQSFEISSNELFLPTLFTPNGDLTNDRFIVRGGGNVASIQMKVFDRDNNLVFSSESLMELFQTGWDGDGQPQGAYVWVISGSFTDGSPLLVNGKETGIIRLAR